MISLSSQVRRRRSCDHDGSPVAVPWQLGTGCSSARIPAWPWLAKTLMANVNLRGSATEVERLRRVLMARSMPQFVAVVGYRSKLLRLVIQAKPEGGATNATC